MLKVISASMIIIFLAISIGGCAGAVNSPTVTPTITATPAPSVWAVTASVQKIMPTPDPSAILHGVVTLDGTPVKDYRINVNFESKQGMIVAAQGITDNNGNYAIQMNPGSLKSMSYSNLRVSDDQGNELYSDSSTHPISNQSLDFNLTKKP